MVLSYDRGKFASLLAAHLRSDLARRHVHVAMYSFGSLSGYLEVGTQSASLDGSRAVENAFKHVK